MSEPVSVGYLILVHADPEHFGRLLRRLQAPWAHFAVHLDAKADLAEFERAAADVPRITFCTRRVDVHWAGFSVVEATLSLIETAAAMPDEVRRFVLLSGADYPIVSTDRIRAIFAAAPDREYIRGFAVEGSHPTQEWKIRGWHWRDLANRGTLMRKPLAAVERLARLFPRDTLTRRRVVVGSQWWSLTRACALHCLERARSDPAVRRDFAATYAPDEMFFQTLVHDSPFASAAGDLEPFHPSVARDRDLRAYANLHYLNGTTVDTAEQARVIFDNPQGYPFARKFGSGPSRDALAVLDRLIDAMGSA